MRDSFVLTLLLVALVLLAWLVSIALTAKGDLREIRHDVSLERRAVKTFAARTLGLIPPPPPDVVAPDTN
jgi:hypothetical protein